MTRVKILAAAWNRFWFAPRSTANLAAMRIVFGLLAVGWAVSLAPNVSDFLGPASVAPAEPENLRDGIWSVFVISREDWAPLATSLCMLVAAACLTIGYRTRLSAVVVFVCLMSFTRGDPFVFNSGDALMRILAFHMALAPCGAALSVDRWRAARETFWQFPRLPGWNIRLLQLQFSALYISAAWTKARGATWADGTALYYVFHLDDLARFPLPDAIAESLVVSNVLAYGTLGLELALGVLVWNKTVRPYLLVAGASLHLGIDWALRVGFFSYATLVLYLAFVPADALERLAERVRVRVQRRGKAPAGGSNTLADPAAADYVSPGCP